MSSLCTCQQDTALEPKKKISYSINKQCFCIFYANNYGFPMVNLIIIIIWIKHYDKMRFQMLNNSVILTVRAYLLKIRRSNIFLKKKDR